MEVDQVGCAPTSVSLVWPIVLASHRAEEVHAPLRALGLTLIDVKEPKRDLDLRAPVLVLPRDGGVCGELVGVQVGDVEPVKSGAWGAHLAGVVDEGVESHVVGGDLELKVGLGVIRALVLCARQESQF